MVFFVGFRIKSNKSKFKLKKNQQNISIIN